MTKKSIIILPDPALRQVSSPISDITDDIRVLANDMLETMYEAPGIGLAAIQVNVPLRLFVLDVAEKDSPKQPLVIINPEIEWRSEERNVYEEGCLSIPDYYAEVERPEKVTLSYVDLKGEKNILPADGLLATCIQHEIDHLDGVLFIDHISKLKRDIVIRKFKKLDRDKKGKRL